MCGPTLVLVHNSSLITESFLKLFFGTFSFGHQQAISTRFIRLLGAPGAHRTTASVAGREEEPPVVDTPLSWPGRVLGSENNKWDRRKDWCRCFSHSRQQHHPHTAHLWAGKTNSRTERCCSGLLHGHIVPSPGSSEVRHRRAGTHRCNAQKEFG